MNKYIASMLGIGVTLISACSGEQAHNVAATPMPQCPFETAKIDYNDTTAQLSVLEDNCKENVPGGWSASYQQVAELNTQQVCLSTGGSIVNENGDNQVHAGYRDNPDGSLDFNVICYNDKGEVYTVSMNIPADKVEEIRKF